MEALTGAVNRASIYMWQGVAVLRIAVSPVMNVARALQIFIPFFTRPGRPMSMGDYFLFEDYTGRESPMALAYFTSWDALAGSLAGKFKNQKGGRRVLKGRYAFHSPDSDEQIGQHLQWEQAIVPGRKITMSLFCKIAEGDKDPEDKTQSFKCLRCKKPCEGVFGKGIQW